MKKYWILLTIVCFCSLTYGQGQMDASKMSGTTLTGTARGQSMANAFGALGGDPTGVIINPAGAGIYRSSELSATLDYSNISYETSRESTALKYSKNQFTLNDISYIHYTPMGSDFLQSINFAFSYHKTNNFTMKGRSTGRGMRTSLTDYVAAGSYGIKGYEMEPNNYPYQKSLPWLSILSYQGGLIVNGESDREYVPNLLEKDETVDPELELEETGYIHSYDFALGFNFSNNLYLGATFVVNDINYEMTSYYRENFQHGGGYQLYNWLRSEGAGYQLKLGAIWRPISQLRLGVSYHSPVWYEMTDYYLADVQSSFHGSAHTPNENNAGDYRFQSPYSWTFSAAGIIGTKGIVSVDYEIKDYKSMALHEPDGYSYGDNDLIDYNFRIASTFRIGAEYRITPQLSARLGFAGTDSPYTAGLKNGNVDPVMKGTIAHYEIETGTKYYTVGLGYRFTPQFYLDIAFVHRNQSGELHYFPNLYDDKGQALHSNNFAEITKQTNKGLLTLGYKF